MYTGTFDGNGKSVYGLTAALFGYTGEGALVKNVTVYGSNHAADDKDTAPKGGISNQAYGSFEGCVSDMTISAKWSVVGGIVAFILGREERYPRAALCDRSYHRLRQLWCNQQQLDRRGPKFSDLRCRGRRYRRFVFWPNYPQLQCRCCDSCTKGLRRRRRYRWCAEERGDFGLL